MHSAFMYYVRQYIFVDLFLLCFFKVGKKAIKAETSDRAVNISVLQCGLIGFVFMEVFFLRKQNKLFEKAICGFLIGFSQE